LTAWSNGASWRSGIAVKDQNTERECLQIMRGKKDYSKSKEVNRMAYSIDVVVLELKPDFDPFGGEYVFVSFGYK
jgi:hypothetical protein